MARTQDLETWTEIFALGEIATEHHDAAARLERLAAGCDDGVRPGLLARARVERQLGDEASAEADRLRRQRYVIEVSHG